MVIIVLEIGRRRLSLDALIVNTDIVLNQLVAHIRD